MREMSLAEDLCRQIQELAKKEKLCRVNRVKVDIGVLRMVEDKMLSFAFQTLSRGSIAENAQLEVCYVPVTMQCQDCKHCFEVQEQTYVCPSCDGTKLEFIKGKELLLTEIE